MSNIEETVQDGKINKTRIEKEQTEHPIAERNYDQERDKEILKNLERIVGYALLTPPLLSVVLFIIVSVKEHIYQFDTYGGYFKGSYWMGYDATSPLPTYFGLMAIAGAYLIKTNSKE